MPLTPEQKIDVANRIQSGEFPDKIALATYIQGLQSTPVEQAPTEASPLPAEGPGSFQLPIPIEDPEKVAAEQALGGSTPGMVGLGRAAAGIAETAKKFLGLDTSKDKEAREIYEQGIGQTGAAQAGKFAGDVLFTAPIGGVASAGTKAAVSSILPAAARTQAILSGAAGGASELAAMSPDDTGEAAGIGAAIGGVLPVVGPAIVGSSRAVKGLVKPFTEAGQRQEAGKLLPKSVSETEALKRTLAKEDPQMAVKLAEEKATTAEKLPDLSTAELEARIAAKEAPEILPKPPSENITRKKSSEEAFKIKERYRNAAKEVERSLWRKIPDDVGAPIAPLRDKIDDFEKTVSRDDLKLLPKDQMGTIRELAGIEETSRIGKTSLKEYQAILSNLKAKKRQFEVGENKNLNAARLHGELIKTISKHIDDQKINVSEYQKARQATAEYDAIYGYKAGAKGELTSKKVLPSEFLEKVTGSPEQIDLFKKMITKGEVTDPEAMVKLKDYTVRRALRSPTWGEGVINKVPGAAKEIERNRALIAQLNKIEGQKVKMPVPFSKESKALDAIMYGTALTHGVGTMGSTIVGLPAYWIAKKSGMDLLKYPKEEVMKLLKQAVDDPVFAKALKEEATPQEIRGAVKFFRDLLPKARTGVIAASAAGRD